MDSEQAELPNDGTPQTLDLDTLESHLWEAADILRGSIDAADYKNYIFGILSLKRVNNRFNEETEEAVEEEGIDEEIVRKTRAFLRLPPLPVRTVDLPVVLPVQHVFT
ncbi:type I restriction-modification system subunit M N-terminal domain-containing protein [Salarchaeum sp. III]|uniref:type I restriction-modification system subunit M N-terminal domain-containing protein n=1 Tax=Salarchaeum sp. III TaxID=3107927 RepID=UPI002EDB1EB6